MALICNKENKFEEATRLIRQARTFEGKNVDDRSRTLAVEAETMFMQKKYDRVIDIASELLPDKYAEEDTKGIVMIYLINIYTERGELSKAFGYISNAEKATGLKTGPTCSNRSQSCTRHPATTDTRWNIWTRLWFTTTL